MQSPVPASFGIYTHVPWCRSRCPYCAFSVEVHPEPDTTGWLQAILESWSAEAQHFPGSAHSLYLGGGTPSLLPPQIVADLIDALPLQAGAEVTLEANPGTVDQSRLAQFRDAGITRLSIGVQSLQPAVARRLGRGHTVEQAAQLLHDVSTVGFESWSIDLIFGVPDQTLDDLKTDLEAVLGAAVPHVSLYGLTIEPGTPFADLARSGMLKLPDVNAWRAQYDHIVDVLSQSGWHRYEVSNFARSGHRARHNEAVWRGGFYAGLGPSAHGFRPDGARTTNENTVAPWMCAPRTRADRPSSADAAVDHLLSTLRHCDGTRHDALLDASGHRLCSKTTEDLTNAGLILSSESGVQLQPDAFVVADGIVRRLSDTLVS